MKHFPRQNKLKLHYVEFGPGDVGCYLEDFIDDRYHLRHGVRVTIEQGNDKTREKAYAILLENLKKEKAASNAEFDALIKFVKSEKKNV